MRCEWHIEQADISISHLLRKSFAESFHNPRGSQTETKQNFTLKLQPTFLCVRFVHIFHHHRSEVVNKLVAVMKHESRVEEKDRAVLVAEESGLLLVVSSADRLHTVTVVTRQIRLKDTATQTRWVTLTSMGNGIKT